jgi:hypothetical protein
MADKDREALATLEGEEVDDGPKQTIKRLPPDIEVGPFFPSGMSAPEAGMAGAVANLSDADKEKLAEEAKFVGISDAGLIAASKDDPDE